MSGGEEFVEGDGLVAAGAGSAGAESGAEQVAVLAALLPDVAGVAVRALIDAAAPACWGWLGGVVGPAVSVAVGALTAWLQ